MGKGRKSEDSVKLAVLTDVQPLKKNILQFMASLSLIPIFISICFMMRVNFWSYFAIFADVTDFTF